MRLIGFQDQAEGIYLTAQMILRPKSRDEREARRVMEGLADAMKSFTITPQGIPLFSVEVKDVPGTAGDYVQVRISLQARDFTKMQGDKAVASTLVYKGGQAKFTDVIEELTRVLANQAEEEGGPEGGGEDE